MRIRQLRVALAFLCCAAGTFARPVYGQSSASTPPVFAAVQDSQAAQAAQDSTEDDATTGEKGDKKLHGKKVVRPGGEIHPIFVFRPKAAEATLLAIAGALLLALPVAGVYEFTSKRRTTLDRALTQSILLLPPIVAGIVMVVQGSLALAFSLAGVATTVRFRSSLKDTNDAVYIFLSLAIGIAAGAQALDIALVVSLGSCIAALIVWRITGSIHHPPVVLTEGDDDAHGAASAPGTAPAAPTAAPGQSSALGHDDGRDATLLVWAPHDDHAREAIESLLEGLTKQWRLEVIDEEPNGDARLRYSVRCKKRVDAEALVAAITAAGAAQGIRAELDASHPGANKETPHASAEPAAPPAGGTPAPAT